MAARFSDWSHSIAHGYLLRAEMASVSKACTPTSHTEEPSVLLVP